MAEYIISYGKPYPLGATVNRDGSVNISFAARGNGVTGINLYKKNNRKAPVAHIELDSSYRIGGIYCVHIEGIDIDNTEYTLLDGEEHCDIYSRQIRGNESWGEVSEDILHSGFVRNDDEYSGAEKLEYSNSIIYLVHVRGFTKHMSGKVKNPGTFEGIVEKIPYLKDLGVTTLELMPAYEFSEARKKAEKTNIIRHGEKDIDLKKDIALNYWGYGEGYYFAPKASFAADPENAAKSFGDMVKALHKEGMEVVMQFNFPDTIKPGFILEVLKYWVLTYGVDGFHLMGERIPLTLIATEPLLLDTKIMYYNFPAWEIYGKEKPVYKNLGIYNDETMYNFRKFLKSDEGQIQGVINSMRQVDEQFGKIASITNGNGFTLMDLVSYDRKHNEENGEGNRDGNPYNASWNCGVEGNTNKKAVKALRRRQIKNAIAFTLFSQSTPLIVSGDEFGNSQNGNNNPYCIDSPVTWLNWKDLEKNRDIYEFYRTCIKIRKNNPILHMKQPFRMTDYLSKGFPDLSFHGEEAWRVETDDLTRHFAMLFSSEYAFDTKKNTVAESIKNTPYYGEYIYIGINMHWSSHELALPALPGKFKWTKIIDTSIEKSIVECELNNPKKILINERSIIVLIAK